MRPIDDPARFNAAVAAFDAANSADPNRERDGRLAEPGALVYARRMSRMLARFAPDASEAVRLAVRCQHIRRWEIPRAEYPKTPEGYRAWRKRLMDFHAEIAGRILEAVGYEAEAVAHVQALVRKERIKHDPDAPLARLGGDDGAEEPGAVGGVEQQLGGGREVPDHGVVGSPGTAGQASRGARHGNRAEI